MTNIYRCFAFVFLVLLCLSSKASDHEDDCDLLRQDTAVFLMDNFKFYKSHESAPVNFKSVVLEHADFLSDRYEDLSLCYKEKIKNTPSDAQVLEGVLTSYTWVRDFGTFSLDVNLLAERIRAGSIKSDKQINFGFNLLKEDLRKIVTWL